MLRSLLIALAFLPLSLQAAPMTAVLLPDKSLGLLLVAALFYFGFKWRAR